MEQDRTPPLFVPHDQLAGKPLRSFRTMIQLIAATTTTTGLTVRVELDDNKYPKGVKTSNAAVAALNISRHVFRGEWNYTISPLP